MQAVQLKAIPVLFVCFPFLGGGSLLHQTPQNLGRKDRLIQLEFQNDKEGSWGSRGLPCFLAVTLVTQYFTSWWCHCV